MDDRLMELKKDNIMEQTLETDLSWRHGDRALLPSGYVVWGREMLMHFCINLLESSALVHKRSYLCLAGRKYTKHRSWSTVGVQRRTTHDADNDSNLTQM